MKVKTDYDGCSYITKGKIYDVEFDCDGDEMIVDDQGDLINIDFDDCPHLYGNAWQVVEEESFDITKHELVDYGYIGIKHNKNLYVKKNGFTIDRERSIAIAKHFNLTAEDLK